MIEFEQEEFENLRAKIKVIGVGGAGGNAVKRMIEAGLTGIEFYAVNTDQQALLTCRGATQIQIGVNTTEGLGSGANPDIGRKAAEEDREHLQTIVENANMVFITAGMGGGTGTGAAPLIASLARERGALTIGVVTRPFNFEGQRRADQAETGLDELRAAADSVIVVPNQRLIDTMDRKLPIRDAFRIGDQILLHGVQSISDIITEAGEINVDFADVESIMREAGSALMGMGRATGDNRAQIAAEQAISSPLLEQTNIAGAIGMIVNITAPPDFMMHELDEAMQVIKDTATDAQIIFGLVYKDELELGDEVLVTVIATGFDLIYPMSSPVRKENTPHGMMTPTFIKDNLHLHTNNVRQLPAGPDPVLIEHYQVGLLPQFVVGDPPNHLWNRRNNHLSRRRNPDQHAERIRSNGVIQIGKSRRFSASKKRAE